jgi:hypothetical protein
MNLELTGEETEALLKELTHIIDGDRYQFSARIRTLKEIRAKIRPTRCASRCRLHRNNMPRRKRMRPGDAAIGGRRLKSQPAPPPVTLGNAAENLSGLGRVGELGLSGEMIMANRSMTSFLPSALTGKFSARPIPHISR